MGSGSFNHYSPLGTGGTSKVISVLIINYKMYIYHILNLIQRMEKNNFEKCVFFSSIAPYINVMRIHKN